MLERTSMPRLVVAGVGAGSGKTTLALGLVGALRNRGRTVQTFKVGPDFVDTAYLAHVSRRPCRNLDSWMLGAEGVRHSFARGSADADCAVVEGTAGIFDGHGQPQELTTASGRFAGSTAELSRLIGAPVVLVVDVSSCAETAAAVALGVKQLDPGLDLIGVVLNSVPGEHRRLVVEDAIWSWAKLPVLGALPPLPSIQIPEARTGLLPLSQNPQVDPALAGLVAAVERHCDVDLIERLMARAARLHTANGHVPVTDTAPSPVRVGVAFDEAFCFYYTENLEQIEQAGGQVITFSPLDDVALPRDLDAIYLGGGVSEMFVPRLSENRGFIESLRRAHAHGVPIYAEGCGLLYCARSLRTSDGATHPMAGLLPVDTALEAGLCHSGYRELTFASDGILGARGHAVRGHEFHFSRILGGARELMPAYSVHDADGQPLGSEGWCTSNLFASLVHLHFGQDPALAARFVAAGREHTRRRHLEVAGV